jgi:prepilin-type processing-associated H-X9-DG protein
MQNYISVNGSLPPTSVRSPTTDEPPRVIGYLGMNTRILPFLEQNAIYNAINFSIASEGPNGENDTALTSQINSFNCPSDGNVPSYAYKLKNGTGSQLIGYTSYPNNIGTIYSNNGGRLDGPAYAFGYPTYGPTVTLANLVDGTSNTAIFSEWVRGRNETRQFGLHQLYVTSTPPPKTSSTYLSPMTYLSACKASQTIFTVWSRKGEDWLTSHAGEGGPYSHLMTPNLNACLFAGDNENTNLRTLIGASSYHSGGVNVSFLDGSVHFVKSSISPVTWWAIATMAGNEVISASSL